MKNLFKNKTSLNSIWRFFIPLICSVSLVFYLLFSNGLHFLLSSWAYHLQLIKMVFPNGVLQGLSLHLPSIPPIPTSHNEFLLAGFIATCLASGWLAHSLMRGNKYDLGPHLILFSFAAAIVPTLILATVFWLDGRGKLTLDMTLRSSLFILITMVGLNLTLYKSKPPNKTEMLQVNHSSVRWGWFFMPPLVVMIGFSYLIGSISIIGYDALAYHMPLAATWFNHATIIRCFDIQCYYPGNAELIMRWGFIDGSERFVFLIPFTSTVFCIYMIYKLGREIGQKKDSAFVAACCASSVPMIPFLSTTAYTDTFSTFLLLLSVFFLIRWIKTDLVSISALICAGLAAGLAAGTKISVLPQTFVIAIAVTFALFRSKQIWRITGSQVEEVALSWSWLVTRIITFFSAAVLGGGYWYLRNFIEFKNPFYPVKAFGFPGVDISEILPIDKILENSPWEFLLYPWTELSYTAIFDDGIGAVATAIVIPALIFWPFIYKKAKETKTIGPGIVYFITLASLIMFIWSNTTKMRYGVFVILISFVFIGELWQRVPSIWLKLVTLSAYLIMAAAISQSLAGGYLYEYLRSNETRAEKLNIPEIVDHLPTTRIFNAADSSHTYGLMGRDYRHEVVSLFRDATPEDVISYTATHVLLKKSQEDLFRSKILLEQVGEATAGAEPVSLWKVIKTP